MRIASIPEIPMQIHASLLEPQIAYCNFENRSSREHGSGILSFYLYLIAIFQPLVPHMTIVIE